MPANGFRSAPSKIDIDDVPCTRGFKDYELDPIHHVCHSPVRKEKECGSIYSLYDFENVFLFLYNENSEKKKLLTLPKWSQGL